MLGGGEHSFLDLLIHLPNEWKPFAALPKQGELMTRLNEKAIPAHVLPLIPIRPWRIPQMLLAVRGYFQLASSLRPSLIYANGSRAAFYAGIAGRLLGRPVVWHCRITEPDPYLDPLLLRLCTVVIANSHATSRRFVPRFKTKVRVVYNGIDIQRLKDPSVEEIHPFTGQCKILLVVAGIHRPKRHDIILSAFEEVAHLDPTLHLALIGGKDKLDWWRHLQETTRRSMFSDRLHWLGTVEDLRPWYRAAWVLILASESESFGRVLVEAMGSGTPVIATRVGGIPEIVRNGQEGLLFSPGSSEQLANAIKKLLEEESLRMRLAQAAFRRADSFGLELHIRNMLKVFNEVCGYA
jgi:glycosyltransferase involved in cell wall biosynthesis